jgi:hypothetical protein
MDELDVESREPSHELIVPMEIEEPSVPSWASFVPLCLLLFLGVF